MFKADLETGQHQAGWEVRKEGCCNLDDELAFYRAGFFTARTQGERKDANQLVHFEISRI